MIMLLECKLKSEGTSTRYGYSYSTADFGIFIAKGIQILNSYISTQVVHAKLIAQFLWETVA